MPKVNNSSGFDIICHMRKKGCSYPLFCILVMLLIQIEVRQDTCSRESGSGHCNLAAYIPGGNGANRYRGKQSGLIVIVHHHQSIESCQCYAIFALSIDMERVHTQKVKKILIGLN